VGSGLNPPREARFALRQERLNLSEVPRLAARSHVQAVITRATHAAVAGASTARLFELAALEGVLLCNPAAGQDAWFTPGREVAVCSSPAEVLAHLRTLVREPLLRREMGRRARRRVLDEHTTAVRARRLIQETEAL
jgi:spore maturation protein CgeB